MSKYVKGEKIKDMNELVEIVNKGESIYHSGICRAMNFWWVRNQQFNTLINQFRFLYKAELKPREEKKNGR